MTECTSLQHKGHFMLDPSYLVNTCVEKGQRYQTILPHCLPLATFNSHNILVLISHSVNILVTQAPLLLDSSQETDATLNLIFIIELQLPSSQDKHRLILISHVNWYNDQLQQNINMLQFTFLSEMHKQCPRGREKSQCGIWKGKPCDLWRITWEFSSLEVCAKE